MVRKPPSEEVTAEHQVESNGGVSRSEIWERRAAGRGSSASGWGWELAWRSPGAVERPAGGAGAGGEVTSVDREAAQGGLLGPGRHCIVYLALR